MKNIFYLLLLSLLFFRLALSQEDEALSQSESKIIRMGGAGGFTPYILFWNVKQLNNALKTEMGPQIENNPLLLYGGEGYGYIMFIENLRIGGMGAGGITKSSTVLSGTRMDLETSVSFGGVTIDYCIPVNERFDVLIGALIGGGSLDLKLRRDTWNLKTWDDILNSWGTRGTVFVNNFSYSIGGSFFVYKPGVKFEYAILRWLGVRLGVSYYGMTGGDWKLDETFELIGVPDKINASGIMLDAGVFLGTFLF